MRKLPIIMLVEDEAIIAKLITYDLAELGYEVAAKASSGEKAVELAKSVKPDLLFMDIRLAGAMDGIEAARLILQFTRCHLVFMTAYGSPEVKQAAMALKPLIFIEKPVPSATLNTIMEAYYSRLE